MREVTAQKRRFFSLNLQKNKVAMVPIHIEQLGIDRLHAPPAAEMDKSKGGCWLDNENTCIEITGATSVLIGPLGLLVSKSERSR